jgi:hypothetical protein
VVLQVRLRDKTRGGLPLEALPVPRGHRQDNKTGLQGVLPVQVVNKGLRNPDRQEERVQQRRIVVGENNPREGRRPREGPVRSRERGKKPLKGGEASPLQVDKGLVRPRGKRSHRQVSSLPALEVKGVSLRSLQDSLLLEDRKADRPRGKRFHRQASPPLADRKGQVSSLLVLEARRTRLKGLRNSPPRVERPNPPQMNREPGRARGKRSHRQASLPLVGREGLISSLPVPEGKRARPRPPLSRLPQVEEVSSKGPLPLVQREGKRGQSKGQAPVRVVWQGKGEVQTPHRVKGVCLRRVSKKR